MRASLCECVSDALSIVMQLPQGWAEGRGTGDGGVVDCCNAACASQSVSLQLFVRLEFVNEEVLGSLRDDGVSKTGERKHEREEAGFTNGKETCTCSYPWA
ncbi:unnamed protein product [Ectocarpus sp. 4 AP-2014]